jgi:hypothetical protein
MVVLLAERLASVLVEGLAGENLAAEGTSKVLLKIAEEKLISACARGRERDMKLDIHDAIAGPWR